MAGEIESSAGSIGEGYSWGPRAHTPSFADLERDEAIRELRDQVSGLAREVARLSCENNRLESMIGEMGAKMNEMLTVLKGITGSFEASLNPAVIIVEEMDKPTAKQKVFDFMKEHGTSDIEQLHENIRCDIGLLIEIIDELFAEGTIAGGD